jgi:hypothetical protein
MNSILENQEHKLFQPLPLRNNIIPKNIILDIACIIDVFCPDNSKKSELLKKVKENQFDIWNNLLDFNNNSFKKRIMNLIIKFQRMELVVPYYLFEKI